MTVTAIRTVIIYIFIILALRVTGKRQIGELQPVELVVTLLISDLAIVPMQENSIPLISGLIPIAILVSLELILSTLMMKSTKLSQIINGNPVVLITRGKLDQKALRKMRLGVDDLTESMRQQELFDIQKIDCAIAETNGKISFFEKSNTDTAHVPIINDGETVAWGLTFCHLNKTQVKSIVAEKGYDEKEVLLMTADRHHNVVIIRKEKPH